MGITSIVTSSCRYVSSALPNRGRSGKNYGRHFDGIPYLNGGLFLPHQVEIAHGITPEAVEAGTLPADITIPNEQFAAWFDFFDSYRWTLDEENAEYEGHINPDILGYIFEKYINQKQMGAYYTKEDITGYICRNTIIPRLFDMLAATGKKGAQAVNPLPIGPHPNLFNNGRGISGGEGIERYIYPAVKTQEYLPTETEREYLARQQRYELSARISKMAKLPPLTILSLIIWISSGWRWILSPAFRMPKCCGISTSMDYGKSPCSTRPAARALSSSPR